MIKNIVFDLGKVILDFDHHTISENLSKATGNSEAGIFDYIFKDTDLEKLFDLGKISPEEFSEKIMRRFDMKISFETFSKLWCEIFTPHPGIDNILKELKPRYRLGLLSNTNKLHFEYAKRTFGMLEMFDDLYLSYEMGMIKPDLEIFRMVIKKSGRKGDEILFIDDIETNVVAAGKAGINALQFKGTGNLKTELVKCGVAV
jgi:putative hydrolase of the HAD superfamily